MSYIRFGQERRWSDGEPDLYAYPSAAGIVLAGHGTIPAWDWIEVTMRMLERGDFSDGGLDAMHDTLQDAACVDFDPKEAAAGPNNKG